jgi:hypothetical protein
MREDAAVDAANSIHYLLVLWQEGFGVLEEHFIEGCEEGRLIVLCLCCKSEILSLHLINEGGTNL